MDLYCNYKELNFNLNSNTILYFFMYYNIILQLKCMLFNILIILYVFNANLLHLSINFKHIVNSKIHSEQIIQLNNN